MSEGLLEDKEFTVTISSYYTTEGRYQVSIGTTFPSFEKACEGADAMLVELERKGIEGFNNTYFANRVIPRRNNNAKAPAKKQVNKEFSISSARLKYTDNGKPFLLMKLQPGLMKFGVYCWSEVFEPYYGTAEEIEDKYGRGKNIPTPENISTAVVLYEGEKASKVIRLK
ncbi:MAG: hypothetical protein JEZ00_20830 [Anaerolineaceae bacterium]|nr:hypothetical protein [Anaerolineaceae bacterium]